MVARTPTLLLLLLPALLAGCPGLARIDPTRLDGAEELAFGGPELPARERLAYRASWNGFPAGEVEVVFERGPELWRGSGVVTTVGLATALYGSRLTAESAVGATDCLSRAFSWSNRSKSVEVSFEPEEGRVFSVIREDGEDDEEIDLVLPGARDPFATLLALRRSDLTPGRSYRTGFFTDRHPYLAEALADVVEEVRVTAGTFRTVHVRVDYRKVEDGEVEESARGMAFWFAEAAPHIPVKAVMETDIGKVWLELVSYGEGGG